MRPPQATDHVVEPRLRVVMLQKHAPYNSGEERGLPASMARRYCVLGLAMPAPKRAEGIKVMNRETGEYETVEDKLGGWSLSTDEAAAARQLDKAKKEAAGDYKQEQEDLEARAKAEEQRVEEAAGKPTVVGSPRKPGGFLRGGKDKPGKPKAATKNKPEKSKGETKDKPDDDKT